MYVWNEHHFFHDTKKDRPIMTNSARRQLAKERYAEQFHPSLRHIFLNK